MSSTQILVYIFSALCLSNTNIGDFTGKIVMTRAKCPDRLDSFWSQ